MSQDEDELQERLALGNRATRNADLPPPFSNDILENAFCIPDNEPPIADNLRGKLRTLANLVQEKLVPIRYQLKSRKASDNLKYSLGDKLYNLEVDNLRNQINILEEYYEEVMDTMIQLEDYMIQNPEFVLDFSKFEIPGPASTGFENDMSVVPHMDGDILQVETVNILGKIQSLERNLDIRIRHNPMDQELHVKKGQVAAARLILESLL